MVSALVCVAKGKYRLALIAIFLPPVSYIGAIRLARPGSLWDHRRYHAAPGAARRKAVERDVEFDRRWDPGFSWLGNTIAGKPR